MNKRRQSYDHHFQRPIFHTSLMVNEEKISVPVRRYKSNKSYKTFLNKSLYDVTHKIRVIKNGNYRINSVIVYRSIPELLENASRMLSLETPATKIFNIEGKELKKLEQVQKYDEVFISKGEKFCSNVQKIIKGVLTIINNDSRCRFIDMNICYTEYELIDSQKSWNKFYNLLLFRAVRDLLSFHADSTITKTSSTDFNLFNDGGKRIEKFKDIGNNIRDYYGSTDSYGPLYLVGNHNEMNEDFCKKARDKLLKVQQKREIEKKNRRKVEPFRLKKSSQYQNEIESKYSKCFNINRNMMKDVCLINPESRDTPPFSKTFITIRLEPKDVGVSIKPKKEISNEQLGRYIYDRMKEQNTFTRLYPFTKISAVISGRYMEVSKMIDYDTIVNMEKIYISSKNEYMIHGENCLVISAKRILLDKQLGQLTESQFSTEKNIVGKFLKQNNQMAYPLTWKEITKSELDSMASELTITEHEPETIHSFVALNPTGVFFKHIDIINQVYRLDFSTQKEIVDKKEQALKKYQFFRFEPNGVIYHSIFSNLTLRPKKEKEFMFKKILKENEKKENEEKKTSKFGKAKKVDNTFKVYEVEMCEITKSNNLSLPKWTFNDDGSLSIYFNGKLYYLTLTKFLNKNYNLMKNDSSKTEGEDDDDDIFLPQLIVAPKLENVHQYWAIKPNDVMISRNSKYFCQEWKNRNLFWPTKSQMEKAKQKTEKQKKDKQKKAKSAKESGLSRSLSCSVTNLEKNNLRWPISGNLVIASKLKSNQRPIFYVKINGTSNKTFQQIKLKRNQELNSLLNHSTNKVELQSRIDVLCQEEINQFLNDCMKELSVKQLSVKQKFRNCLDSNGVTITNLRKVPSESIIYLSAGEQFADPNWPVVSRKITRMKYDLERLTLFYQLNNLTNHVLKSSEYDNQVIIDYSLLSNEDIERTANGTEKLDNLLENKFQYAKVEQTKNKELESFQDLNKDVDGDKLEKFIFQFYQNHLMFDEETKQIMTNDRKRILTISGNIQQIEEEINQYKESKCWKLFKLELFHKNDGKLKHKNYFTKFLPQKINDDENIYYFLLQNHSSFVLSIDMPTTELLNKKIGRINNWTTSHISDSCQLCIRPKFTQFVASQIFSVTKLDEYHNLISPFTTNDNERHLTFAKQCNLCLSLINEDQNIIGGTLKREKSSKETNYVCIVCEQFIHQNNMDSNRNMKSKKSFVCSSKRSDLLVDGKNLRFSFLHLNEYEFGESIMNDIELIICDLTAQIKDTELSICQLKNLQHCNILAFAQNVPLIDQPKSARSTNVYHLLENATSALNSPSAYNAIFSFNKTRLLSVHDILKDTNQLYQEQYEKIIKMFNDFFSLIKSLSQFKTFDSSKINFQIIDHKDLHIDHSAFYYIPLSLLPSMSRIFSTFNLEFSVRNKSQDYDLNLLLKLPFPTLFSATNNLLINIPEVIDRDNLNKMIEERKIYDKFFHELKEKIVFVCETIDKEESVHKRIFNIFPQLKILNNMNPLEFFFCLNKLRKEKHNFTADKQKSRNDYWRNQLVQNAMELQTLNKVAQKKHDKQLERETIKENKENLSQNSGKIHIVVQLENNSKLHGIEIQNWDNTINQIKLRFKLPNDAFSIIHSKTNEKIKEFNKLVNGDTYEIRKNSMNNRPDIDNYQDILRRIK
ncbi:hypothetical protein SNEBB_008218 [Seison nebaliae]|nr:hypothetical protein SNEBB_008218 [Seison nebaliae]